MSMNNNNPPNIPGGSSSVYGNAGMMASGLPMRPAFGQSQSQFGGGLQNQYPSSSQVQAVARAQAQVIAQAQARAQAQAAQAQYQAQLQAQGVGLNAYQNSGFGGFGGASNNLSLGGADGRRFSQIPQPGPQGASVYSAPSMNAMELTPAAQRMKQQNLERRTPKKVAPLLPESALYTQLLEFENQVDAALMNKKEDIQEAMRNPPCVQKTLRIYVFNTFANQVQSTDNDDNAEPPTWTLRVTGRILADDEDPNQPGAQHRSNASSPKFSSFFKRVTITLDEQLYPVNNVIVWDQARSAAVHDGFEVKRKGDKEFNAQVKLEMNYSPKKFRLSPPLAALLGMEVDTRARIIAALWHYVKGRNLQDPNDPTVFNCDPYLQQIFGEHRMKFTMASQKISPHLAPPSPITLDHRVRLSGSAPAADMCYDVSVDMPFLIQQDLANLFDKTDKANEIKACDAVIADSLLKIQEHRKRRAFFLGFSQSPVEFINALIESQSRDLKLVAGESARDAEKEHVTEFYKQPWVEDAVIRYLNRKPAAGKAGRGRP
uniref:DM2 domain-containing protein n=1 Tax=Kalanchoe fedtschenkoi TaxID=63787 RepID=A0A7N0V8P4_KALFE